MIFSSEEFLFVFLPVVVAVYYLLLRKSFLLKNIFLFIVSIIFYAWGEPKNVMLLIFVIFFNWLMGILVDRYRDKKQLAYTVLGVTALVDIGILGIYKYSAFILSNLNSFKIFNFKVPNIILPIGISFFTFQAISYVIDIYRKNGEVQKNPLNVGLYISFFPQLIAGPIVRYQTVAFQIGNRKESFDMFSDGVARFIFGMGKKVLIADNLAMIADSIFEFAGNGEFMASALTAWIGALAYTFQIFFDFSGYSDMAIGLGKMFGFEFDENFNYPYIAKSISEFWRRWHISLQTWFRDYVYFPLGGSRVKSKGRLIFNIFVVWALTGIWHGANWTFILWGLMYFVLIALEKFTGFDKKLGYFSHVYTMFFVIMGWVLFRAPNVADAVCYYKAMFGIGVPLIDGSTVAYINQGLVYFIIAMVFSIPVFRKLDEKYRDKTVWNVIYTGFSLIILFLSLTFIFNNSYSPFLYFNF